MRSNGLVKTVYACMGYGNEIFMPVEQSVSRIQFLHEAELA